MVALGERPRLLNQGFHQTGGRNFLFPVGYVAGFKFRQCEQVLDQALHALCLGEHDALDAAPLGARLVLLTFELDDGKQLSFVVDVLWTQSTNGQFTSGGSVLAAGVPEPGQPRSLAPLSRAV